MTSDINEQPQEQVVVDTNQQPENGLNHLEETVKETEALKLELKEQQNKYLYLYAEFDTYKKRVMKERSELIKFGYESFARNLLQVADNLGRALQHPDNHEALVAGIQMVNQQLKDTLNKFGVIPLISLGSKFDPECHEAVGSEKLNNSADGGTIVQELEQGYTLHGRLLRPARVVVGIK